MGTVEVRINGRVYPCRMTMGAMLRYRRLTGKEVSEMEGGSVSELATLLYCCTASACSADGVEFGMSLDEFCDLIGPEDMERMSAGIRADESGDGGSKKSRRRNSGAAGRGRRRDGDGSGRLLLDDPGGVPAGAQGMDGARGVEDAERMGDDKDSVGLRPPALEQEAAEALGRAEVPMGLGGAD